LLFHHAQGKQLVFVTNNSTKSRKGYLGKFTGLGLNVRAEEIYSSSYAAAAYLESINFPKEKKVGIPRADALPPHRCPESSELISTIYFTVRHASVAACQSRSAQSMRSTLHASCGEPHRVTSMLYVLLTRAS